VPKHTPGPWRNDPEIGVTFGPDGTAIQTGGGGCGEEYRANAALIAAAPEMLEALKDMIDWQDGKGDVDYIELQTKARVAIAKAETV
jgi:hypothetical protein